MRDHEVSDEQWESILSPEPGFDALCIKILDQVRVLERLESIICREHLGLADLVVEAKKVYEASTGAGKGKRNPASLPDFAHALAEAVGKEASWVQRYVTIAKLDAVTRDRITGNVKLVGTQSLLLNLARESNVERRLEAVAAYESGGRKAFDDVLRSTSIIAVLDDPLPDNYPDSEQQRQDVTGFIDEKTKKERREEEREEQRRIDARQMVDCIKNMGVATLGAMRKELGFSPQKARKLIGALLDAEIVESATRFTGEDDQRFSCELEEHEIDMHRLPSSKAPPKSIVMLFPTRDVVRLPPGHYRVSCVERGQDPMRITLTRTK